MSPRFAVFLTAMGLIAVIRADSQAQPLSSTNKGFDEARRRLVDDEIVGAGIKDPRVIDAMRATLRHEFVPLNQRAKAYYDMALPIGEKQTISPPFIVAYMTEQLQTRPEDKVLEIGTGSGYQCAVLAELAQADLHLLCPKTSAFRQLLDRLDPALRRLRADGGMARIEAEMPAFRP